MNSNCRVYPNLHSVRNPLSSLHDTPELSVGIIDTSTEARLRTVLDWYTTHMDLDLHVMTTDGRLDVQALQESFPSVTCIVFTASGFNGEKINQFAYGCRSRFFFITRSDADLVFFDGASMTKLMAQENHPAMVLPLRLNNKGEFTPDIRVPLLTGDGRIDVESDMPKVPDGGAMPSLYPIMEMGLYDTALFQRLRGYDEQIHSEYWQAMDWGIRCWMMGYPLYLSQLAVLFFPGNLSLVEDQSESEGWRRCSTKALILKVAEGRRPEIVKPRRDFDHDAWEQDVRLRYRYLVKQDYPTLVRNWGKM